MNHLDHASYGLVLFAALALLAKWKFRRDTAAERMKRGLTGYVAHQKEDEVKVEAEVEAEARV